MRMLLLMIMASLQALMAADVLATFSADEPPGARVAVAVALDDGELAVTFTPVSFLGGEALHLYATTVPKGGIDGIGRPTLVEIPPGQGLRATGPLRVDPPVAVHELDGLPVFADGPVTLRLPVALPPGDGSPVDATILVTYMSCTTTSCNRPVTDRELTIAVPSDPQAVAMTTSALPAQPTIDEEHLRTVIDEAVAEAVDAAFAKQADTERIRWQPVKTVAEIEAAIAAAHAQGQAAMLDFTGPSCAVCQRMKQTVFIDPRVRAAWNAGVPIEVDTDRSPELGRWQREQFNTDARPLYVRIEPDGSSEQWSQFFSPDDEEMMAAYLAFLAGGAGANTGSGHGWVEFLLLAIGGGLFTLLMPCTYPMIPLTVNFFTKQAAGGHRLLPFALAYSLGIVACFVGIGLLVSQVLKTSVSSAAGNPWVNAVIGLFFLVLGLSLLGAFLLRLPARLQGMFAGRARSGYIGALLMGLTFAVTAFTCTAPFAGAVLAEGVASGSMLRPVIGMAVYASAIAVPFFVLAMAPGLLAKLPRAGSWMNEFKHVGGLVEIAAALKFLLICDIAWGWGVLGRSSVLIIWVVLSGICGLYVMGTLRMEGDETIERLGVWRLLLASAWFALALWFLAGLFGAADLGVVESFFPVSV